MRGADAQADEALHARAELVERDDEDGEHYLAPSDDALPEQHAGAEVLADE